MTVGTQEERINALGRVLPNLVLIRDSELRKGNEFRVQCEVVFNNEPKANARFAEIEEWFRTRSPEDFERARVAVLESIPDEARPIFREIIKLAFEANRPIK